MQTTAELLTLKTPVYNYTFTMKAMHVVFPQKDELGVVWVWSMSASKQALTHIKRF